MPLSPNTSASKVYIAPDFSLKDLWEGVPAKMLYWLAGGIITISSLAFTAGTQFLPPEACNNYTENHTLEEDGNSQNKLSVLRLRHQVRKMDDLENQRTIKELPPGIYGYVHGDSLDKYLRKKINTFSVANKSDFLKFEIHYLQDKALFIVGYVAVKRTSKSNETKPYIRLFNTQLPGTILKSIEVSKIKSFEVSDFKTSDYQGLIAYIEVR